MEIVSHLPVIDWEQGIKLAGNKKDLAEDVLNFLVKDLHQNLPLINSLYKTKNFAELVKQLHKLHGALCYSATPRLKVIVARLESDLKNNIIKNLSSLLIQLNSEVNLLLEHHSLLHS